MQCETSAHFVVEDTDLAQVTLSPIPNIPSGSITLSLYDKIKPAETTYNVKSMKIELVLKKAVPGKWAVLRQEQSSIFDNIAVGQASHGTRDDFVALAKGAGYQTPNAFAIDKFGGDTQAWYNDLRQKLSGTQSIDIPAAANPSSTSAKTATATNTEQPKPSSNITPAAKTPLPKPSAPSNDAPPAYPTSSKTGPKNWDKMDLDGDDEEDESKTDADYFFKKLYKDADPDTRRAMMKSYVQSNGTSLSTSWSEAASKDYETQPPDSMEAKDWDE
jgi:suppressor of G2 allele of SKP1